MKNTEKDYISQGNGSNMTTEKIKPHYNKKQPDITGPDESEEKPAKILPIIDRHKKEEIKDNNLNAGINEADESDNSGSE